MKTRRSGRLGVLSSSVALALVAALPVVSVGAVASKYDWAQFDGSETHQGVNTAETTLSTANVARLKLTFAARLPSPTDGSPVYLSDVSTRLGTRDLLYVTTTAGHLIALDAHTGRSVWQRLYAAQQCRINQGSSPCYTTSSPAIDPNRQFVYGYGLDGSVHKYLVGSGVEVHGAGWPELVTRKPWDEKGSSALSTATDAVGNRYLYVANGGYPGDRGNYQGHLTTINLATGAQHVFNTLCSNVADVHFSEPPNAPVCPAFQSAVWARAGATYDPATNKTYIATGNGPFNPQAHDWGDSVLALNPDGTGASGGPVDSYTPANYQTLQQNDTDLGSTLAAILPPVSGSSVSHLGVQGGKDSVLRFLNLDNLSGQGGPGHTGGEVGATFRVPQGGEVLTHPATWTDSQGNVWVFVANGNGISGIKVTATTTGVPQFSAGWTASAGGTSPIIVNGVLFYLSYNGIRALNPATGSLLWQATAGRVHWQTPIVDNGMLYVPDNAGYLRAYTPAP